MAHTAKGASPHGEERTDLHNVMVAARTIWDYHIEVTCVAMFVAGWAWIVSHLGGFSGPATDAADVAATKSPAAGIGDLAVARWWTQVRDIVGSQQFHESALRSLLLLAASVTISMSVGAVRRVSVLTLRRGRMRRRLHRGIAAVSPAQQGSRRVRIKRLRPTPSGWLITVRLPSGPSYEDFAARAERLTAAMRQRQVIVTRDANDASIVTVRVISRDPFPCLLAPPWPGWIASKPTCRDSVPVAVDLDGYPVELVLEGLNILIGGEPGSGKSGAINTILGTAALDPHTRIHIFDPKTVELAAWAPVADTFVGADPHEAVTALEKLVALMESRYLELRERHTRKIGPDDDIHLVVIDEMARLLACGERGVEQRTEALLRDLVARGRAAGIVVVAATQKPSVDVIPSSIRDLFAVRWVMRCATAAASDTVLGSGYATLGYSGASIDLNARGVGYLHAEGADPVLCRAYYLDDDEIAVIVNRAVRVRGEHRATLGGDHSDALA